MVHDLEMPFALARFQIDADDAVAEEVVARAMPAVVVRRWIFNRQVDEPCFFVHGDLRPDAGVAVDGPRLVLPRLVAEFAGTRSRVHRPQRLAGPRAEGPGA